MPHRGDPLEDFANWVSATAIRNSVLDDPLADWLARFGAERGFLRDDQAPGYDPRTDFTRFLFGQAARFEAAVVRCLSDLVEVVRLEAGLRPRPGPGAAATLELMRAGAAVIYHGVVVDPATQTFGEPDLLVRSDVLARLFPEALTQGEAEVAAPTLGHDHHYRVVDIKFTTLRLTAGGQLLNTGTAAAYRAQVFVYTRAVGAMQGYVPPVGYALGRSWEVRNRSGVTRGSGCMERLGTVDQRDARLAHSVNRGVAWVRRVRSEGQEWEVFPRPSAPELWPNVTRNQDGPWRHAKTQIAEKLEDATLLWGVGRRARAAAHWAGVYSWRDPRCTAALLGLGQPALTAGDETNPQPAAPGRARTLDAMLAVNRAPHGPPLLPTRVRAAEGDWRPEAPLEFYVDFETVSDLADDFSAMPMRAGQAMIFLIGCGHLENGSWSFRSFVADDLTQASEGRMLDAWYEHMAAVRSRLAVDGPEPWVFHWSGAEASTLETAYNSAANRHADRSWPRPRWFDFLGRVIRAEPVVVRGALGFGLKSMAQAMHAEGLIETSWPEGIPDGLSAAVGAWRSQEDAAALGVPLAEAPLMQDIAAYNEVDCKVVMEIVRYLRAQH